MLSSSYASPAAVRMDRKEGYIKKDGEERKGGR